jgi:hypothetical protein
MAVTVTNIVGSRYWPELLPHTQIAPVLAGGATVSPTPLDLRRFGLKVITLRDIAVTQNNNLQMEITMDQEEAIRNRLGAAIDPMFSFQERIQMPFAVKATNTLTLSIQNVSGVAINNFKILFPVEIDIPSVAQKIFHDLPLDTQEQQINRDLNIEEQVRDGQLPKEFEQILQDEYRIIQRFTRTIRIANVPADPAAAASFLLEPTLEDEVLVVTGIGASPFLDTDNFRIRIKRDDQFGWAEVHPSALDNIDRTMQMWIPAIRELEFSAIAANPLLNAEVRINLIRAKLTDRLRIRWGLMTREDNPNLYAQVRGGL